LEAARKQWTEPHPKSFGIWMYSWAGTLTSKESAIAALEQLPNYGPPPKKPGTLNVGGETAWANVLARAGRFDEALPFLKRVSVSCFQLESPLYYVRALYWLGQTYEGLGDLSGARAAYERAVAVYGNAKPRSVHAERA